MLAVMTVTDLIPTATHLASDNYAPAHPDVLAALVAVNTGHTPSYGDDPVTTRLRETVSNLLGVPAQVYPVLTGSGANILSITAATPRWGAVLLSSHGHMITEEGGAAARLSGIPLIHVPSEDGKLTVQDLDAIDLKQGFVHSPQPTTLNIANTTELGTVYTPGEITALCDWAHAHNLLVHMDGARIFNAMAATGASMRELTADAGVDIFSIGATKTGAFAAEAVVVLNPAITGTNFEQKYLGQMASKSRYISAQILALLNNNLGVDLAEASNKAATALVAGLAAAEATGALPHLEVTQRVESNQVFVKMPHALAEEMRDSVLFYDWDVTTSEIRWVTSWDTKVEDVDYFIATLVAAHHELASHAESH